MTANIKIKNLVTNPNMRISAHETIKIIQPIYEQTYIPQSILKIIIYSGDKRRLYLK